MGETTQDPVMLTEHEADLVRQAIRSVEAGLAVPFDQVEAWVRSWGSAAELPKAEATG